MKMPIKLHVHDQHLDNHTITVWMNSSELGWHKESHVLSAGLQSALRSLLKRSHAVPLPDTCPFIVLNFMSRDTWGTTEYLCSSYYHNILRYDSHGENYAVDVLHLAMNPGTQTHPQHPSLLSFAQDLLISGLSYIVCVSAFMYTHMYVLHTALSISSAECIYSFFTSEIPLTAYSVERSCGYPVPLESLGGNSISSFFFFSSLGVVPSLVVCKALSLLFLTISLFIYSRLTYMSLLAPQCPAAQAF